MAEPLVRAWQLGRSYFQGDALAHALVSASCEVEAGARVAITGPSGSGKSTLLHILGGLEKPSSGEISWPALGAPESLRPTEIAVAFQTPSLEPTWTVVENVELPLLLDERERAPRETALYVLELLGVDELADRLPDELSAGQAQRVALARALACRTRLLLVDEPTGQLDRATARRVVDALIGRAAAHGAALVLATHDQTVAERMETRWRIRHGVLCTRPDAPG